MKRATILLFALLLSLPTVVQAQPSHSNSPSWWTKVEKQTIINLTSPKADVRTQALKNAIYLGTMYRDKFSLYRAENSLMQINRDDASELNRELALAALQVLGSARADDYLSKYMTEEQSTRTRLLIAEVLSEQASRPTTSL